MATTTKKTRTWLPTPEHWRTFASTGDGVELKHCAVINNMQRMVERQVGWKHNPYNVYVSYCFSPYATAPIEKQDVLVITKWLKKHCPDFRLVRHHIYRPMKQRRVAWVFTGVPPQHFKRVRAGAAANADN